MPRREGDDAQPSRPSPRRSRLNEARGYHPRGRTLNEADGAPRPADPFRPTLRLVAEISEDRPVRRRSPKPVGATATETAPNPPRRRTSAQAGRRDHAVIDIDRSSQPAPVAPPRLADQGRRLRSGAALIIVMLVIVAGRLVQIQLTEAPAWAQRGLELRLETVDLPAPRGNIVDRNGALLAGSAEARYVFADPGLIEDPEATADALVPVLGVPRSDLLPKLEPHTRDDGTSVRFEYLARGIPVDTGNRVSALKLTGIGVLRDESRVVPGHDLAANLIGFTGTDLTGLAGLEAAYDDVLRGVDGKRTYEIGQPDGDVNLDHEIPGGFSQTTPAKPGSTIQLTIDRDLQYEIQRLLGLRMSAVKADIGAAVVLDVRNGEVLAQASYPFYNAAKPFAFAEADRGDNATGFVVEPGSVHKGIVFAACLQEGVINQNSTVTVNPSITKGAVTFTDTHPHSKPTEMTLPGILAWSSNVGTIELADKLGAENLYAYQRAFGLGSMTGEGLPGESAGLVQPPANWSETSHGSIPIGHGVSVTPLQMAAVYAAIANGGRWVQPHLVKSVVAADGTQTPSGTAPSRQVISAENASILRRMLEAVVVAPEATGRSAAVDNYRVAGKTGTGRIIRDGKPVSGEVASFIGMAPADAPRYVIAVFAHTPAGTGGGVAGPAFSAMMQYTLLHYRVAPTGTKPPTFRIYPA